MLKRGFKGHVPGGMKVRQAGQVKALEQEWAF
jgi:hypothetical protein